MQRVISGSTADYAYRTQPEPFTCAENEQKTCNLPRGKGMGGSSSTNGMWYARGTRHDYDYWASLGNAGWSYDEILAYFKKSEDVRIPAVSELLNDWYNYCIL